MRIRERDGMWAMVDLEPVGEDAGRLRMSVARDGRPLWSSVREVRLVDADRTSVERTAIEAALAIADHLRRRDRGRVTRRT